MVRYSNIKYLLSLYYITGKLLQTDTSVLDEI